MDSDTNNVRRKSNDTSDSNSDDAVTIHICHVCQQYLQSPRDDNDEEDDSNHDNHTTTKKGTVVFDLNGGTVQLTFRTRPFRECCFVCLGLWQQQSDSTETDTDSTVNSSRSQDDCNNTFIQNLLASVREASQPYNSSSNYDGNNCKGYTNRYSRHKSVPTIVVPGDIIYRFVFIHELLLFRSRLHLTTNSSTPPPTQIPSLPSLSNLTLLLQNYVADLKPHMKRTIQDCCNRMEYYETTNLNDHDDYYNTEYPSCIRDEELGYLTFHTIVVPTITHRTMDFLLQQQQQQQQHRKNKRTRKERTMKQNSQYATIQNDTTVDRKDTDNTTINDTPYIEQSQGGDPRVNFERRFNGYGLPLHHWKKGNDDTLLWSIPQAMDQLLHLHKYITTLLHQELNNRNNHNQQLYEHLKSMSISRQAENQRNDTVAATGITAPLSCYTTVWRRPFYIRGIYTKIYRTISQTPFFVVDDVAVNGNTNPVPIGIATSNHRSNSSNSVQKRRRRLGTTSVEEVITPYILQATNGVATHNNAITNRSSEPEPSNGGSGAISGVVYGMAKFHASGREDMNVRMLLPSCYNYDDHDSSGKDRILSHAPNITGRPFVYEIYDAIRLPRIHDLRTIVSSINHIPSSSSTLSMIEARKQRRSYGCNPLGVDVSREIAFVPSSSYKRLQEETENKIKYYECYCWSEQSIDHIIQLHRRKRKQKQQDPVDLHTVDREVLLNDLLFGHVTFPIELQQRTPIRVLHRRTNLIRPRYIYSCRIQLLTTSEKDDIDYRMDTNVSGSPNDRSDDVRRVTNPPPYQPHHFIVHLSTSAGTYVKEFIHGDMGRTVPNLSTLFGTNNGGDGCRTDILELDCTGIQS